MVAPPGDAASLGGCDQFFNGLEGQDGRGGTWLAGTIGASDGDAADLSGEDLDLAVAKMFRQASKANQSEGPAEERVPWIGDSNMAFACLRAQRGITLAAVSAWRIAPMVNASSRVVESGGDHHARLGE